MSPGDTILAHSPEQAAEFRAATADARHRQASGLAPAGSAVRQPAPAPSAVPLPMLGVARQILGAHLGRMRQQVAGIERDLSVPPIGATGQQVPYLVEAHRQARLNLEVLRGEIARLDALDDAQVQAWAGAHLAANPGRIR